MQHYPQHIKKYCSQSDFDALESGKKNFDIKIGNVQVEEGDYVTFIELSTDKEETGRTITRMVKFVQRLEASPQEDVEVIGLTEIDNPLREAFEDHFLMAFVIDKYADSWEVTDGPDYWPILICPPLLESGILDDLPIDRWPVGVYCCHLRIQPKIKDEHSPVLLTIVNQMIIVLTEGEGEAAGTIIGQEADPTALAMGKALGIYGHQIDPAPPSKVAEYYVGETPPEMDLPPTMEDLTSEEALTQYFANLSEVEREGAERIIEDLEKARKDVDHGQEG